MKLLTLAGLLFLTNYATCLEVPSLPIPSSNEFVQQLTSSLSTDPLWDLLNQIQDPISQLILDPLATATGIDALELYTLPKIATLTPCEWIELYGYKCEQHYVNSTDGFILSMQRIKGRYGNSTTLRSHPVILSHGLLTSGRDWVLSGKPKSIAFEMADNDIDVWMPSYRGTDLSNTHINLKPTDPGFYNFSFHEMGIYDLPSIIEYVKLENGADQVVHVGFSQGSSAFFVMFSEMPEFTSANVKLHIALAPGVQTCHLTNSLSVIFGLVLDSQTALTTYYEATGHVNFLQYTVWLFENLAGLCYNIKDTVPFLCPLVFGILVDYNNRFVTDRGTLPLVVAKSLKVTSSKQILHYNQNMNLCDFYRYRGILGNPLEIYNLTHPVDTKLVAFTSTDDHFVLTKNVLKLQGNLTNTPMHVYIMDSYYHENMVFDMGSHNGYRDNFFAEIYDATVIV